METSHEITPEQAGQTIAAVVRDLVPGTSWSQAKDLCKSGRVWIGGRAATDPARRLAGGERVEIRSGPGRSATADLVVHLDPEIVVVRKPAGILTVPFEREDRDTLLALARVAIRRMRGSGGSPTLRTVQRLDKDTSGLVVFARSVPAQRHLQEQLSAHTVTRRYLAIAHGEVRDGVHESLFVPDRGDGLRGSWGRYRREKGAPPPTAKEAITRVRVAERLRGATLAECELETGRQHQIRIHLAEAGHPLVGETVYVRDYLRDNRGPLLPAPRPMLHAAVLGFVHPRTGKSMRFEDPLPGDFLDVLETLRLPRS
ncbi:MAG TPA: pseudouridine synthase [Thermoanaerobaculia bacterium]|jgi:23S rRNA pseudouridine1911/1915/1917 synthase|nr:pseudouridine synthase [Thermoanaerobaculia bacterium]